MEAGKEAGGAGQRTCPAAAGRAWGPVPPQVPTLPALSETKIVPVGEDHFVSRMVSWDHRFLLYGDLWGSVSKSSSVVTPPGFSFLANRINISSFIYFRKKYYEVKV